MILLIHREAVEKNPEKYPLNSNLILLILIAAMSMSIIACFKFQSDSINTDCAYLPISVVSPLNSNLILLILALATLLILATYFKFQSDSINTYCTGYTNNHNHIL